MTVLIVLFLLGVGTALGTYIRSFTNNVTSQLTVKVWLDDKATADQIKTIQTKLTASPLAEVGSVKFVSKDAAYEEAKRKYKKVLTVGVGNPFPARLEAKASDPQQTRDLALLVSGMPGLDAAKPNPSYGEKTADRVLSVTRKIGIVIAAITIALSVAAVLLIGNTIRLSIFARRREIEVMKLVGATNWFVRIPFVIEGMLCGLLGAVGAVLTLLFSYQIAVKSWFDTSTGTEASALPFPILAGILILAGVGLGAIRIRYDAAPVPSRLT